MPNSWINPEYLKDSIINKIRAGFLKSKPYPNFNLNNFFNETKLLKLKKEISKEKFERRNKDLFSFSNTKELRYSENKAIGEFFSFLSSEGFLELIEKLTNEKNLKNIDMHAHDFVQGDYLLFHDDVVEDRKIAYIVYLSDFKKSDGGKLRFYDINHPIKPVKSIIPKFNSFACFKVSERSLHDVEEVKSNKSRLTVGGWLYGN